MITHIFNNNRVLCRCIFNFIPDLSFIYPRNYKIRFCSNSTRIDDVSERFRHLKGSFPKNFDSDYHKSDFEDQNSFEQSVNKTNNDVTLDNYSLENVESALMQFVPEYISSVKDDDISFMTPGQAFFLENKDKLMETVRKRYYEEKNMSKDRAEYELEDEETISSLMDYDFNEESFGSYGSEFQPPTKKEHLWDYDSSSLCVQREPIELTKGEMPNIQQIVEILDQERLTEVSVMDMNKFERRDQGLYAIVATGTTPAHCRRVGRLLYNVIVDLEIPFVSKVSYCCNSRNDEWIISHLGPLSVHLMTKEVRKKYSLEDVWSEHLLTKKDTSQDLLVE